MMKKKETKSPAKSELEKNKSLRQKSGHPAALQIQSQKEFVQKARKKWKA